MKFLEGLLKVAFVLVLANGLWNIGQFGADPGSVTPLGLGTSVVSAWLVLRSVTARTEEGKDPLVRW